MALLKIDEAKCRRDGLCVRDCPAFIIAMEKGEGYPYVAEELESACLLCGHCVAVCPHGALSHRAMPVEAMVPVRDELVVNDEQAVQFLRSRRSIRLYQDKPVEQEKIIRLLEVARYAPTGSNSQMVEWVVIQDRSRITDIARLTVEFLRRLLKNDPQAAVTRPYLLKTVEAWDSGRDTVLRGAPVILAASAPKEALNGPVDVSLALGYVDLLAPRLGLGTCFAGLLNAAIMYSPPVKAAVGVPGDHPHHYPMMLGYPAVRHYRLPERKPPKITFR